MPSAPPIGDREYAQAPTRPKPVNTAFTLWVVNAALGLITFVVSLLVGGDAARDAARDQLRASGETISDAQIDSAVTAALAVAGIIAALFFALYLLFAFKMRAGRNWARIVLTVLGVLGIISNLYSLAAGGAGGVGLVLTVIQVALIGTAIFLMWQKESTHYFEAAKHAG